MNKKICTKCNSEKELGLFGKDKRMRSGRRPQCKSCEHASPGQILKRMRQRIKTNNYKKIRVFITKEEIEKIEKICFFCKKNTEESFAIHRIDNDKDYSKENVVLVHRTCHSAHHSKERTRDEFGRYKK